MRENIKRGQMGRGGIIFHVRPILRKMIQGCNFTNVAPPMSPLLPTDPEPSPGSGLTLLIKKYVSACNF